MKFEASKLHIAKTSIAKLDESWMISKNFIGHKVEFEQEKNLSITIRENGGYLDIFKDRFILGNIGNHCCEGEPHVGIFPNDIEFMVKTLWLYESNSHIYNQRIEKYLLKLKPFYTFEELKEVLNYLESKNNDTSPFPNRKPFTFKYPINPNIRSNSRTNAS